MSFQFQAGRSAASIPPLPPNDLPDPLPPQPDPDIYPEPVPVTEPTPEQDPDTPQPGQITPPIIAGSRAN